MDVIGQFEQAVLVALVRLDKDAYGRAILNEVQKRLHRDVSALTARLADMGLHVALGCGRPLAEYLSEVDVEQRVTCVSRTGWHEIAGAKCFDEANNEIVRDTRQLAIDRGLIAPSESRTAANAVAQYSLLFDLTYKNLAILYGRKHASAREKIDAVPPDLPRHFIGLVDQMRQQLAARDVPLVLSTFIVKFRRSQPRETQIANADVDFYYMPWMSIDGMLDAMDTYNRAILDYAAAARLPVVDDRDAIPPDAEHFSDCMHFVDKGAEAMADRFFRHLQGSAVLTRAIDKARSSSK